MPSLRHRRQCAYVTNINIAATYYSLYLQQSFFFLDVCPPPTYIMPASLTLTDTSAGLLHIFLCIIIRTGYSPLNCGARYPCVCGPHKRMRMRRADYCGEFRWMSHATAFARMHVNVTAGGQQRPRQGPVPNASANAYASYKWCA